MDHGADAVAQLQMAGDEVGVEVGQEHMADLAAGPFGRLQIATDVALRVHHRSNSAALVRDEVRRVGEAAEIVLVEDHPRRGFAYDPTFSRGSGTMRM